MIMMRTELLVRLYENGLKYWEIQHVLDEQYGITLSLRHLKRLLKALGLQRRNYSNIDTVISFIQNELKESGQLHGYRMMLARCRENNLSVRSNDVRMILRQLDPEAVSLRTARSIRRRAYYAPGPNFIWHVDGYDKLKPFGICISGCICGFSRKIIWLNAYHTNNNPKVIGGYFLEAIKQFGCCPRFVRADYGTENGHIRNFQTFFLRHLPNSSNSYIDGSSTANQRIESWWGYLRRQHIQFWIETFKYLQNCCQFSGNFLDKSLIQFCFTALIQNELDTALGMWNNHSIRPSTNSMVPYGRPNNMFFFPLLWNTDDKGVVVTDDDWIACSTEAEFRIVVPCDNDVYEVCIGIMQELGISPPYTRDEATELYLKLRREILARL